MADSRYFMEEAYKEMLLTVRDNDADKTSPMVGAVLVRNGQIIARAHRCQTRDGHHAEQTLLDDLNPDVSFEDNDALYVTLEPCIPEARSEKEISCAKRIVDARIKHVYIGMLDPNPKIYRKGVNYLLDHGVVVGYFDNDISEKIRAENIAFIEQFGEFDRDIYRKIEELLRRDLSKEAVEYYCQKAEVSFEESYNHFWDRMIKYGLIRIDGKEIEISREFKIFFCMDPYRWCDGAEYHLVVNYSENNMANFLGRPHEYSEIYSGPMILAIEKVNEWIERHVLKVQIRDLVTYHGTVVDKGAMLEAAVNSIVHRDYGDNGMFCYFRLDDRWLSFSNPAEISEEEFEEIRHFKKKPDPKNPKIARLFRDMNLMERDGNGMNTFKALNPPPVYTKDLKFISLVFPMGENNASKTISEVYGCGELKKEDTALFNYIRSNGAVSTRDVSKAFMIPERTASYHINKLAKMNLIKQTGSSRTNGSRYMAN